MSDRELRVPATIRALEPDDREDVHRVVMRAFAPTPGAAYDPDRPRIRDDRRLVAELDGRVVGHLGAWDLGHHLGGRTVATAGISAVVVEPEVRGGAIGSDLLRHGLRAARERGEPLATLFPITRGVYRRQGFELAGTHPRTTFDVAALVRLPRPTSPVRLEPGGIDDVEACLALEQRVARHEPGMLVRSPTFARRSLEPDDDRFLVLARRDGELVGHLAYHHERGAADHELYRLEVDELVATDADSRLALWRVLGSSASAARTATAIVAAEDPVHLWLPERADTDPATRARWMVRLVDAAAAVAARGWPDHLRATIQLDIADPTFADQRGPHVLEVVDGAGSLTPGGDGRVQVDIGALGAWFTGYASGRGLAGAGRLHGAGAGDLDALDALTAGPTPWVRTFF